MEHEDFILGRIAYEAYCRLFSADLPEFYHAEPLIQASWVAIAVAVRERCGC